MRLIVSYMLENERSFGKAYEQQLQIDSKIAPETLYRLLYTEITANNFLGKTGHVYLFILSAHQWHNWLSLAKLESCFPVENTQDFLKLAAPKLCKVARRLGRYAYLDLHYLWVTYWSWLHRAEQLYFVNQQYWAFLNNQVLPTPIPFSSYYHWFLIARFLEFPVLYCLLLSAALVSQVPISWLVTVWFFITQLLNLVQPAHLRLRSSILVCLFPKCIVSLEQIRLTLQTVILVVLILVLKMA